MRVLIPVASTFRSETAKARAQCGWRWLLCFFCCLGGFASGQAVEAESHYAWRNVVIGGGGFVTGLLAHEQQRDLLYARTDVGGAYRWESTLQQWVPLTDWIGAADVNLLGIESFAVDAQDSNRLYLAAGTYSGGPAAMLCSTNQGRTFRRVDVPFRMGGNEPGRANGERLAVDPHCGRILFFGSRRDGLWKSGDYGQSWHPVSSWHPDGSPAPDRHRWNAAVGVIAVVFDVASGASGQPTPKIYAAVSTTGTNLFCSLDAGETWQPVPGQPVGLRPNHLARADDGALYLSCGNNPGPGSMSDGAVWRFIPVTGQWSDITPVRPSQAGQPFGYGAVAVDPANPQTVIVSTFCHWGPHDQIFRSTNAGATWQPLWCDNSKWDGSSAPYTQTRTPHWIGSLLIDPFDSGHLLFTTGYGLWSSRNVNTADEQHPTEWTFLDRGLEETVPLALISPPEGAHLLSGVGDVDGFRHDDLDRSPVAGSFAGPRFGNTESLAFAARQPEWIIRTGQAKDPVRAAFSSNGGKTWALLKSEPPGSKGAGHAVLSADGKVIVWTPQGGLAHATRDLGQTWLACQGLRADLEVIPDPENAVVFYAWDAAAGTVLASTNGAAVFTPVGSHFVAVPVSAEYFAGAKLSAAPGRAGELWLAGPRCGLYRSQDGGNTFRQIPGVTTASALGFGRAASGHHEAALFLAGQVQGTNGLFRSDDAGENWVRISDDQHQFAEVHCITGDPRIFGRVYLATSGRGIIYGDLTRKP
jgi:photosystem II stability/assembly factor-like uncharacterized protein